MYKLESVEYEREVLHGIEVEFAIEQDLKCESVEKKIRLKGEIQAEGRELGPSVF
jgi:hypothetical protein